eukprot:3014085-Alexandrium_andersonii.AAC.1
MQSCFRRTGLELCGRGNDLNNAPRSCYAVLGAFRRFSVTGGKRLEVPPAAPSRLKLHSSASCSLRQGCCA